jgi:hypothetical protein
VIDDIDMIITTLPHVAGNLQVSSIPIRQRSRRPLCLTNNGDQHDRDVRKIGLPATADHP